MDWYLKVWQQYFDFSTRARRKEYWFFVLFNTLIIIALSVAEYVLLGDDSKLLSTLYAIAVIIPSYAVAVRRLHDIGRTGWWVLISFIPIIGWLILLYFNVQPSQDGTNEYGPNPLLLK